MSVQHPDLTCPTHGPKIDRIQVDYRRRTTVFPQTDGEHWKSFTRLYDEHLILDRASGTLELQFALGPGRSISHSYQAKEQVVDLLNQFSEEALFGDCYPTTGDGVEQPGAGKDFAENPYRSTSYLITVRYRGKKERRFSGSYDRDCLPRDYARFIQPVLSMLQGFGFGEMLFPETYERNRRKKGELIYCSVEFDDGWKTYYYRTEDDSLDVGDSVIVPAGEDNHPAMARSVKL